MLLNICIGKIDAERNLIKIKTGASQTLKVSEIFFYEFETGQESSGIVDQVLDHLVALKRLVEQGDVVDTALYVVELRVRILMEVL
jgi:hypothetical protein